jgi:hypothetical protein
MSLDQTFVSSLGGTQKRSPLGHVSKHHYLWTQIFFSLQGCPKRSLSKFSSRLMIGAAPQMQMLASDVSHCPRQLSLM